MAPSQRLYAPRYEVASQSFMREHQADIRSQLAKCSSLMYFYSQMECRRWATMCRHGMIYFSFLMECGLTGGPVVLGYRDAGKLVSPYSTFKRLTCIRIVEYATRDQAQQAVNTLSNRDLMGRLVYVREVRDYRLNLYFLSRLHADASPGPRGRASLHGPSATPSSWWL